MISYIEQKDQWYDHFHTLSLDERYDMFMDLMEQGISDDELIKDDFGSLAVDLKSNLISEKQYKKALSLIEKTKESTTEFYQREFPYLSNFAVEYYLYTKDFDKFRAHLQPFIENPGDGYDLFVPLYEKIRFYQMDELALKIAEELEEPIVESDELIDGAETELMDMIFFNNLQEFYQNLKQQNRDTPSFQQLKNTLKKYDDDDTLYEEDLFEVYQTLTSIAAGNGMSVLNNNEWAEAVQDNTIDAMRNLYWSFAVYMLNRGNFHFSISASIWFPFSNMLSKKESPLDFSITYKDLDELIAKFFPLFSNEEEGGFAVTWGIPYIYDFLYGQELISQVTYDNTIKHVTAIKDNLFELYEDELWRFDFVHTWVKPLSVTDESFTEEKKYFHETFIR